MFHIIKYLYFQKVVTSLTTNFLTILEYGKFTEKHKE